QRDERPGPRLEIDPVGGGQRAAVVQAVALGDSGQAHGRAGGHSSASRVAVGRRRRWAAGGSEAAVAIATASSAAPPATNGIAGVSSWVKDAATTRPRPAP